MHAFYTLSQSFLCVKYRLRLVFYPKALYMSSIELSVSDFFPVRPALLMKLLPPNFDSESY